MFHDAYPDERHAGYKLVLAKLAGLCLAAKFLGNKVAMIGVGIGPLKRDFTTKVTEIATKACQFVAVRDIASFTDMNSLSTDTNVVQTHDLSLLAHHDGKKKRDSKIKHIVLSLVPENLMSSVTVQEAAEFNHALPLALSEELASRNDIKLSILVVNQGAHDGDSDVSQQFYEALDERLKKHTTLIPFSGDPTEYLDVINSADIVTGMRFHVAVVASVLKRPTLWLPYQRKVIDGAASLGCDDQYVILPKGSKAAQIVASRIQNAIETGMDASASQLASAKEASFKNIDLLCDLLTKIKNPKSKRGEEYLEDLSVSPPPEPKKVKVHGKR